MARPAVTLAIGLSIFSYLVHGAVYVEDHRKAGGTPIDLDALLLLQPTTLAAEVLETNSSDSDFIPSNNNSSINTTQLWEATLGGSKFSFLVPNVSDTLCAVEVNTSAKVISDKWAATDTSSPTVQAVVTALHNAYRRKHPAANMLEMEWSEEAATLAQAWADQCTWNHSECSQRNTSKFHCGQNIAKADYQMSWNATLQLWYSQIEHFKFDQNPSGVVGDVTQLLWAKSWQVGCGYKFCSASGERFHLYVCNYCPEGNVIPGHFRPFEPSPDRGRVCDQCGGPTSSKCNKGLCTNHCNFTNDLLNCDRADGHFPGLFPDGCATSNNAEFKANCTATCECKERGNIY
ncbi:putative Cysteine-rich secretory protein 2 [Hypsibius exemplaris]|uniref:Cysteine-rich secretory protein 2 n=1 Tax=Hypsibius exemplaris TaxID=2072580 RepID=A0A1W0WNN7_HYPEX|nr:putative Cysteine-rich secretory protein 2 [Hypsibius exemplaris]